MRCFQRKIIPPSLHTGSNPYPTPDNTPVRLLSVPYDREQGVAPQPRPELTGTISAEADPPGGCDISTSSTSAGIYDCFLPPCVRLFNAHSIVQPGTGSFPDIITGVSTIRQKYPESFLLFTHLPPGFYCALTSAHTHIPHSKSTYIPSIGHLLLHPMPTPPHGFVVSFFTSLHMALLISSQITQKEYLDLVPIAHSIGLPARGSPSIIGQKALARCKEADWAMGLRIGVHRKPPDIPTVVMECGVSQKESDLGLDARQWLLRTVDPESSAADQEGGVRCVVLVKILDGPKRGVEKGGRNTDGELDQDGDSDDEGQGHDDPSAYDSDNSTMALYKHVKAQFEASPNLTALWAGEFTAWIEVWRIDSNRVIKMDDRITLLPAQAGSELVLRRSDFGLQRCEGQKAELRVPLEQLVSDLERHARSGLAYSRWIQSRGPVKTGDFGYIPN
ncbi:hypothetical protein EV426DRAFT_575285 [Tirmania nivea]|nr:hypothetical protein EV426DRAFT_575285 [Tirmania nivea]